MPINRTISGSSVISILSPQKPVKLFLTFLWGE
jgi:hypothetical protein